MKRDTQEQRYIIETTGRCVFILSPVINYCTLNTSTLIFGPGNGSPSATNVVLVLVVWVVVIGFSTY